MIWTHSTMARMNWNSARSYVGYESIGSQARDPETRKADYAWRRDNVRKRWPIKCKDCGHRSAVWKTSSELRAAKFKCSECGGKGYCPVRL